jgi:hypothetical protein
MAIGPIEHRSQREGGLSGFHEGDYSQVRQEKEKPACAGFGFGIYLSVNLIVVTALTPDDHNGRNLRVESNKMQWETK